MLGGALLVTDSPDDTLGGALLVNVSPGETLGGAVDIFFHEALLRHRCEHFYNCIIKQNEE